MCKKGAFMKKGKILAFVRKSCALVSALAIAFAAGYGMGVKKSVENMLFKSNEKSAAAGKSDGGYSAILSGKWIYIYDETGALFDTVYVYTEYMTEEDKAALSGGVDFESEEEMRAFIDVFE
jgi:hypothetical protein